MVESRLPHGLIVELLTPLDSEGAVDRRGLAAQLERLRVHADGILLCGPWAGRGLSLTAARRAEVLEAAAAGAGGDTPLLAWITGRSPDETAGNLASLEARVREAGAETPISWVDTPLFHHSNRGLPAYYRDLLSVAGRPVILWNDPELVKESGKALKRSHIRTAVLKELAHLEEIRGLIFTGSLERCRNYRKAAGFRAEFRIYDGDEDQFLAHPSSHGVVSQGANLAPSAWREVAAYSLQGGPEGGGRTDRLRRIWDLGQFLHALRETYLKSPAPLIQGALQASGVLETGAPPYEEPADPAGVSCLASMIKDRGEA